MTEYNPEPPISPAAYRRWVNDTPEPQVSPTMRTLNALKEEWTRPYIDALIEIRDRIDTLLDQPKC